MADECDSPMKPYAPAPSAGGGQGDFYSSSFPSAIASEGKPTPSSGVPNWVQFHGGWEPPAPMASPFDTAIKVDGGGSGDGGRAGTPMDSPMKNTK